MRPALSNSSPVLLSVIFPVLTLPCYFTYLYSCLDHEDTCLRLRSLKKNTDEVGFEFQIDGYGWTLRELWVVKLAAKDPAKRQCSNPGGRC
jgi:hypothetical protein